MFHGTCCVRLGDRFRPSGVSFAHFRRLPILEYYYCLYAWRLAYSLVLQFPTTKIALLRRHYDWKVREMLHQSTPRSAACMIPPRALL